MTVFLHENPRMRAVTGATLRPGGLLLTERAVVRCGLPRSAKILDVGCGLGATVEHLRKKYGFKAFGTDQSARFLAESEECHANLPLFQAMAQFLPCGNETLDAVICECVLSLIHPVQQALKELWRILVPGGYLIVTDMYLRTFAPARSHAPRGNAFPDAPRPCREVKTCLHGAVSQQETRQRIQETGFETLLWEDHSRYLKELAAKLVLAYGSLEDFMGTTGNSESAACAKPGYYLLIARKLRKEKNNDN
ncbi:MAG: class I SAM-dependent methyltransferase [Desulfobacterales bacterium]